MRIGGEYLFARIGERHCVAAAATLGIDADKARDTITRLREGVAPAFETARDELVDADGETKDYANHVLDSVRALRRHR